MIWLIFVSKYGHTRMYVCMYILSFAKHNIYLATQDRSVQDLLPRRCAGPAGGGEGREDHRPRRQVPGLLPRSSGQEVRDIYM